MLKTFNFFILLFFSYQISISQVAKISSPSGSISVLINNGSKLTYGVFMGDKRIIEDSPLGFKFRNEPDIGTDLSLLDSRLCEINENWIPVIKSKHAVIKDHYKLLVLSYVEKSGLRRKIDLEIRAYEDGVALRYKLYSIGTIGNRYITQELTGFNFAGDPKGWIADYKSYKSPQEAEFIPAKLSSIKDSTVAGLPFLIEIDKEHYAAITEAKIINYPGFYIGRDQSSISEGSNLVTKLSPLPFEPINGVKAQFSEKLYTPWRVIMLGKTPGSLIESEIIQNLNDPCAIKDVSWIKPGMSAWDHWWSGEVKQDMLTIKQYIDLASIQGWPYMIIDWQWYGKFNVPEANITKPASQLNMPELLKYARQKNVRLWLWLYASDVNRNNQYEDAFALYEKWGIAGVKIDFMDRDDQEMVKWYRKIIGKAAQHHLLVDFHGAYKPDGIIRTYPNMITREGVMGEEYSKFSDKLTPAHNVTLPFTRMLAGQMDYTPGGFINVKQDDFRQSTPTVIANTRCAELAKFIIYESPLTVYCDHPKNILNQPGADFLKDLPTVWDDIKVLSGYPGEFINLLKRNGQEYFIGSITNSKKRTVKFDFSFLPEGKFTVSLWADDKANPKRIIKMERNVDNKSIISVVLMEGGGCVARIRLK